MRASPGAVVVGFDGSAGSEWALGWAARAAALRSRPLHVVVATGDLAWFAPHDRWLRYNDAADLRRQACERLASSGLMRVSSHVAEETAGAALAAAAGSASMLVVGTRGRGRATGAVLGSVSYDVALHAPSSVVVVRVPHDPTALRILVGVDGSQGSERALGFAFDEASRTQGPLLAIHAFGLQSLRAGATGGYPPTTVRDEIAAGERVLSEAVAGWTEKYPDVDFAAQFIPLHPSRALADASEHAALVVVGPHGRRTLSRSMLGSVSKAMLHHAHCPVAVAR